MEFRIKFYEGDIPTQFQFDQLNPTQFEFSTLKQGQTS